MKIYSLELSELLLIQKENNYHTALTYRIITFELLKNTVALIHMNHPHRPSAFSKQSCASVEYQLINRELCLLSQRAKSKAGR